MTATHTSPRSSYSASSQVPQGLSQRSRRSRARSRSSGARSSAVPSFAVQPQRSFPAVTPLPSRTQQPPHLPQSSRIQQPSPVQQPPQTRSFQGHRRKSRRWYYLSLISEAGLKIVINALLLSAFAVALGRLLPQMWLNNQQRIAIETELDVTQQRIDTLEQHFSETFDPSSSIRLIEQQSYQVDPQKQRIVFLEEAPQGEE